MRPARATKTIWNSSSGMPKHTEMLSLFLYVPFRLPLSLFRPNIPSKSIVVHHDKNVMTKIQRYVHVHSRNINYCVMLELIGY